MAYNNERTLVGAQLAKDFSEPPMYWVDEPEEIEDPEPEEEEDDE